MLLCWIPPEAATTVILPDGKTGEGGEAPGTELLPPPPQPNASSSPATVRPSTASHSLLVLRLPANGTAPTHKHPSHNQEAGQKLRNPPFFTATEPKVTTREDCIEPDPGGSDAGVNVHFAPGGSSAQDSDTGLVRPLA